MFISYHKNTVYIATLCSIGLLVILLGMLLWVSILPIYNLSLVIPMLALFSVENVLIGLVFSGIALSLYHFFVQPNTTPPPPPSSIDINKTLFNTLNLVPKSIILINASSTIVFANTQAAYTFQCKTEDLIGQNAGFLVTNNSKEALLANIQASFEDITANQELEVVAKRDESMFFPANITLSIMPCTQTRLTMLTISDKSLEQMQEERMKLQYFSVEQATDAVFWLDKNAQIIYANEAACRSLGYTALEISLLDALDLVPEALQTDWKDWWNMAKDYQSCVFETELVTKEGDSLPVEVVANYVALQGEEYICAYVRNISHRLTEQERLREYAAQLEHKNKELEQLTYIASHYLQEPLRTMSSFTQLLNLRYKNKLDEDADQFIEYVVEGAKRMRHFLNDLSRYATLSAVDQPAFQQVDLSQVYEKTIHKLQDLVDKHQASITVDKLPEVKGVASSLCLLFQELITNALKYQSNEAPVIHIGVTEQKNYWEFSIKDNGIGIEKEYQSQIFQIFKRLHNYGSGAEGTGIGLAMCKKIVAQHGGQMRLVSEIGTGSIFYFTLPFASPKRGISELELNGHSVNKVCFPRLSPN